MFAAGTIAGAVLRVLWVAFVAIHWADREHRDAAVDPMPRATLVR
jgi:hypothetical protein